MSISIQEAKDMRGLDLDLDLFILIRREYPTFFSFVRKKTETLFSSPYAYAQFVFVLLKIINFRVKVSYPSEVFGHPDLHLGEILYYIRNNEQMIPYWML